jgi:hypothetical protein
MATTYAGLVTEIGSFYHRSDLATIAPTFIALAEAKLNRELRVEDMVSAYAGSISAAEIVLPTDFLEAISLSVGDDPFDFKPRTQFFTLEGNYFTRQGNSLLLAKDITSATDVDLVYYAAIPALSGANTSNWLLAAAPDLYLYSALLEAVPYMRLSADDPRPAQWANARATVIASMSTADDDSRFSGQALTISIPR